MSLIRYLSKGRTEGDQARFGWLDEAGWVRQIGDDRSRLGDILATSGTLDAMEAVAHGPRLAIDELTLRCPIPSPRRVLAAAGNYVAAGRLSMRPDAGPWLFPKMADNPLGPDEAIPLPALAQDVVEEIELALVVGTPGRDIPVGEAGRHIAGWTICNDVSARSLNIDPERRPGPFATFFDWLNGKWFDGFLALGPRIVGTGEIGDVRGLTITTRVNGEVRVHGSTAKMTFPPNELVAFASRLMELQPGDVIATGMPHGAADEVFLRPGDQIEGEISGIGILSNPVASGQPTRAQT